MTEQPRTQGTTRRSTALPPPDFADSAALRVYCDQVRATLRHAAMELHMSAAELNAALATIPAPPGTLMTRSVQRRRARRVSRHMSHSAECIIDASAGLVRTWGAFRAEFAAELAPVRRRKKAKQAFRVVPE